MILDFLASRGSSKSSELAACIGLSPARTRVILSGLTDEGKIQAKGDGRLRRYDLTVMETGSGTDDRKPGGNGRG